MQYSLLGAIIIVLLLSGEVVWNADALENEREIYIIKKLVEAVTGNIKVWNVQRHQHLQYTHEPYNEDVFLNISQLITKYGYPFETHHVITEDGYKLSLFRIPRTGPPIFLMHGFLMSADDWVTAGPEGGIAYLLASEGYDVWMGNARGTKHSRRHLSLSADSAQFWDFSHDEIGRHDLPAMIDYVLNVTGHQRLKFVGFSQGTTVFFVMCSERPDYNDKVSLMVALGAAAALPNTKCPPFRLLSYFTLLHPEIFFSALRQIGYNEFLPKNLSVLCGIDKLATSVCSDIVYHFCGFSYSQINVTNLPVIFGHTPAGASTKQGEHFAQSVTSGMFQRFDYGKVENKRLYGSTTPPSYPVERITTPVAIFCSITDRLTTITDVQIVRKRLRNVKEFYVVPSKDFGHLDFLFSKHVKNLVFARLLYLIKNTLD